MATSSENKRAQIREKLVVRFEDYEKDDERRRKRRDTGLHSELSDEETGYDYDDQRDTLKTTGLTNDSKGTRSEFEEV